MPKLWSGGRCKFELSRLIFLFSKHRKQRAMHLLSCVPDPIRNLFFWSLGHKFYIQVNYQGTLGNDQPLIKVIKFTSHDETKHVYFLSIFKLTIKEHLGMISHSLKLLNSHRLIKPKLSHTFLGHPVALR